MKKKSGRCGKRRVILKNISYLVIITALLFFVGNKLSVSFKNLCYIFKVPEYIVGTVLGFATSVPELITFFEAQRNKLNKNDKQFGVIEATNNLLTSNMVNLFVIQSIGIVISMVVK